MRAISNQLLVSSAGAGKTLISVMLIKYAHEALQPGKEARGGSKTIFLVPKVDLVTQVRFEMQRWPLTRSIFISSYMHPATSP